MKSLRWYDPDQVQRVLLSQSEQFWHPASYDKICKNEGNCQVCFDSLGYFVGIIVNTKK